MAERPVAEIKITLTLRLVIGPNGLESATVEAQSPSVAPGYRENDIPQLSNGRDSYTISCPYCDWSWSYGSQANANRGKDAHVRQMHRDKWTPSKRTSATGLITR